VQAGQGRADSWSAGGGTGGEKGFFLREA
jgi:hypothetical protein